LILAQSKSTGNAFNPKIKDEAPTMSLRIFKIKDVKKKKNQMQGNFKV
jgi:hypothetical protein